MRPSISIWGCVCLLVGPSIGSSIRRYMTLLPKPQEIVEFSGNLCSLCERTTNQDTVNQSLKITRLIIHKQARAHHWPVLALFLLNYCRVAKESNKCKKMSFFPQSGHESDPFLSDSIVFFNGDLTCDLFLHLGSWEEELWFHLLLSLHEFTFFLLWKELLKTRTQVSLFFIIA